MHKITKNVRYGTEPDELLDVYLPENDNFKTVVYFHGGGMVAHGKDSKDAASIAESFVKAGYAFVSADYRIYPNAKFPEFILDAAKAVSFVKGNLQDWGGNGDIIVSGQSAGAWLSLMLCMDKRYLTSFGIDPLGIKGWIIDSAQTTSHFNVLKHETGEHILSQRINEFAPLYFVGEDTRFSKILLIFYENDMPCRFEQNMLFYKTVLAFDKDAVIEYSVLPGSHCHGSTVKDDDGEYAYVKTSLKWLKDKQI